jgi:hypothetical protein
MSKVTCPLTGQIVELHQSLTSISFFYETAKTGKVHFTDIAFPAASGLNPEEKCILTGICRNRTIKGEPPLMITAALLTQLMNQEIPYGFDERARHLLKYLYDNGGKEYKSFNLNSSNDCPITYSSSDEFERIIRYLESEDFIKGKSTRTNAGTFYQGLSLTKSGIDEVEKGLQKIPMFGMVSQKIRTGDSSIDSQIEHARKSFFDIHATLESKRSACETLSFILEPLRNELKTLFQGDTEHFFNIVNNFSIRHNKNTTKSIQHEEQLEWVFYSLLNTINTYYKLKRKLSS